MSPLRRWTAAALMGFAAFAWGADEAAKPAEPAASAADVAAAPAAAASAPAPLMPPSTGSLDNRIQDAKADVIRLNRDLLVLEEELLFPANTQVALFVSMDVGWLFDLESVQI